MSVKEIFSFEPEEEARPFESAMPPDRGAGLLKPVGEYPARFANLSLIDSVSHVLHAATVDREAVESYVTVMATPDQPPQPTATRAHANRAVGGARPPLRMQLLGDEVWLPQPQAEEKTADDTPREAATEEASGSAREMTRLLIRSNYDRCYDPG